jgi:hypothetical protein
LTVAGTVYSGTEEIGTRGANHCDGWAPGLTIPVRYDASDPQFNHVYDGSKMVRLFGGGVLAVLGVIVGRIAGAAQ